MSRDLQGKVVLVSKNRTFSRHINTKASHLKVCTFIQKKNRLHRLTGPLLTGSIKLDDVKMFLTYMFWSKNMS